MTCYAIDCEMAGGYNGENLLVRVSIVDKNLKVRYDEIVCPSEAVVDPRTQYHGLSRTQIQSGRNFSMVQREVASIISGNILVGHSLDGDLRALGLNHPKASLRDVATYGPFTVYNKGNKPSLKDLAWNVLRERIQEGPHDSVEDARTCMKLYNSQPNWF